MADQTKLLGGRPRVPSDPDSYIAYIDKANETIVSIEYALCDIGTTSCVVPTVPNI